MGEEQLARMSARDIILRGWNGRDRLLGHDLLLGTAFRETHAARKGRNMKLARHSKYLPSIVLGLAGFMWSGATLMAQQPAGAGTNTTNPLPDSPQAKDSGTTSKGGTGTFIGYLTTKSLVFPDIAHSPAAMTTGQKFKLFVNQSISPPYLLAAGINAGYSQARNDPKAYGQGWDAYGGRYGAAIARASSNSFFSTFVLSSMLRDDPRFYPQNHPSFWGSIKYSATRIFVTRTDSGNETVNLPRLIGPLGAETLANVYLPTSEQTGAKTAQRYGTDLGWTFAGNMFKNYWPTIFHKLGLNKLKVVPDPGTNHP